MRVAVMVLSLVLMLGVLLQSCAAGIGSELAEGEESTDLANGGWVGLLVALCFLVGGAFVLGHPRFSAWVFAAAAVLGFAGEVERRSRICPCGEAFRVFSPC